MNRITLVTLLIFSSFTLCNGQIFKEKSIHAQIGLGYSTPYNADVIDNGFFVQSELVLKRYSWLEIRPYFGFINTNASGEDLDGNPTFEKAEVTAVLLGGKIRLRAPIPYVAPFVELGLGTSIGRFETITEVDNIDKTGLLFHIPFSLGLQLGKNHDFEIGLTFYYHEGAQQFSGATAIGLSFPLDKKNN